MPCSVLHASISLAAEHLVSNRLNRTEKRAPTVVASPALCNGNSGNMTGMINKSLMRKGERPDITDSYSLAHRTDYDIYYQHVPPLITGFCL